MQLQFLKMMVQISLCVKRKFANCKLSTHFVLNQFQKANNKAIFHQKHKSSYSNTVILPKTNFPQRVEGEKRIQLDENVIHSEEYQKFYDWQAKNLSNRPKYVLHDGPPYANGDPHIGHAVNKILKDITTRCKLLAGFTVRYRPGWDCHGLPIGIYNAKQNNLFGV